MDHRALELSDAGKYSQYHPACRGRRVGPRFVQASEARAGVFQVLGDFEEVSGGTGQPIEGRHHNGIVGSDLIEQARELRPISLSTGDFLLIDALAPGLSERSSLEREILIFGGHAGIAEKHKIVAKVVAIL